MIETIDPGWEAPACVVACCTTRGGGVSAGVYASLNLALHVGDDETAVRQNRERLRQALELPAEPEWIDQTHGTRAVVLERDASRDADAAITRRPGIVAAVMIADCLPILLCDRSGTEVAAIHAGWRGLQAGVIPAALAAMRAAPDALMAWIGPGISAAHFEVGDEVRSAFADTVPGAERFFRPHGEGHWLCDLAAIAESELRTRGVARVFQGGHCTFGDARRFYSYRRDGATGRMAALIWIK